MTEDERMRIERHDRFIDALNALMLGSIRHWQHKTAGDFREYLASAHQLAVEAVYRDDPEAKQTVADAEQVIAGFEMQALQQAGGKTQ